MQKSHYQSLRAGSALADSHIDCGGKTLPGESHQRSWWSPPGRVGYFQIRPTERTPHSRIRNPEGWGTFRSALQSGRRIPEYPTRKGGGLSDPPYRADAAFPNPQPGRVGYFQIRPTERTPHSRIRNPEGWGTFRSALQSGRRIPEYPNPEGWGFPNLPVGGFRSARWLLQ
jgi:hypothetical protein